MAFTHRSQASREAVLAAARRAFARHGYERATVRLIAADAGVDPSMVIRYFASKERLFDAATDIDLRLPDLATVPAGERGAVLAARFVALWDDPVSGEVLTLLLRAAPTSEPAARRIADIFATQVRAMVGSLPVDGSGPRDPDQDAADASTRAATLSAYILGTALTRYVLRLPPAADAPGDVVAASMAPVIQAVLAG